MLLINNKKETSHFLKSLSNAYVFLCRIVGTPLYSIFWKRRIQALYPDFIVCSVCRTFERFYSFKALKPIMYYIIRYNKSNLFWSLLRFSAKNILFIFKSLLLAYCTVFSLYTSLPPNSVYSVVSVTRPVYRKYSRSGKFRLTLATRLIIVVSGCHFWQSVWFSCMGFFAIPDRRLWRFRLNFQRLEFKNSLRYPNF